MTVEVHSDGSSSGKSNLPGGWAYIVIVDGQIKASDHGGDPSTTNNRMEMTGAIKGLELVKALKLRKDGELMLLVSDSEITLNLANGRYNPNTNVDLATRLRALATELRVQTRHVRGHTMRPTDDWSQVSKDVLLNHRCDQLAKLGHQKAKRPELKRLPQMECGCHCDGSLCGGDCIHKCNTHLPF
jgi:ribonuclease HI